MSQDNKVLLRRLHEHGLEFVVIGGVCGLMHGVAIATLDVDICCRFEPENIRRLHTALKDLNPWHRLTPNKLPFELTDELCSRLRNVYLQTDWGKLDCISEVTGVGDFDAVLKHSMEFKMTFGVVKILTLEALIASKEAVGREKDKFALPLLRILAESKKKKSQ